MINTITRPTRPLRDHRAQSAHRHTHQLRRGWRAVRRIDGWRNRRQSEGRGFRQYRNRSQSSLSRWRSLTIFSFRGDGLKPSEIKAKRNKSTVRTGDGLTER